LIRHDFLKDLELFAPDYEHYGASGAHKPSCPTQARSFFAGAYSFTVFAFPEVASIILNHTNNHSAASWIKSSHPLAPFRGTPFIPFWHYVRMTSTNFL
jgi:hypothetical protein